jgi:hypothetical protein
MSYERLSSEPLPQRGQAALICWRVQPHAKGPTSVLTIFDQADQAFQAALSSTPCTPHCIRSHVVVFRRDADRLSVLDLSTKTRPLDRRRTR